MSFFSFEYQMPPNPGWHSLGMLEAANAEHAAARIREESPLAGTISDCVPVRLVQVSEAEYEQRNVHGGDCTPNLSSLYDDGFVPDHGRHEWDDGSAIVPAGECWDFGVHASKIDEAQAHLSRCGGLEHSNCCAHHDAATAGMIDMEMCDQVPEGNWHQPRAEDWT